MRDETEQPVARIAPINVSAGANRSPWSRWWRRLRGDMRANAEHASLGYRFMARLIEREFPRDAGGVALAFSAPDSDVTSTNAILMLAYSLHHELGSHVLMVDARMHDAEGGLTERLNLRNAMGFAEILRDGFDGLEELVVATPVPGVHVLPSGDPGEEGVPIDGRGTQRVLASLAVRYDYVLVQVSSPLRDPRTLVIAAQTSAMFLLAEDNHTFMKTLDDCRKVLLNNGVEDVRVVVTGAKT